MAPTIPQVLHQFKADVGKAIAAETILRICGYLNYVCRDRVLGPVNTVHVFLLQILHGNTACTALSRLAGLPFTAAAYCAARMRKGKRDIVEEGKRGHRRLSLAMSVPKMRGRQPRCWWPAALAA
jgi:hypothetical protein